MLQAFDKHKISREIRNRIWNLEDVKTSSIIGNLLHLPTDVFWNILRNASAQDKQGKELPALLNNDDIIDYEFWPSWALEAKVEPDVFVRFSRFDLIMELKVHDYNQQTSHQWKRELKAYQKHYSKDKKPVYLIAISGKTDETMADVFQCSWQSLLEAVVDAKERLGCKNSWLCRILDDILLAFSVHREYCFTYLDSIQLKQTTILSDYKLFPHFT